MNLILDTNTVNNEAADVMATRVTSLIYFLRIIRLNKCLALPHFPDNGRVFANLIHNILVA